MWGWGRPRRNLPEVNYNESSEDEVDQDFESPLVSPNRPVNTRAGSPVELAVPTLADNVDEELEAVSQTLRNIGHTPLFRQNSQDLPEAEVVEVGFIAGHPAASAVADPPPAAMPDVIPFETENGVDDARALQEACGNLKLLQWDDADVKFFFQQAEIKMAAVGTKKQYTKFQVLSTIIPKKVQDEVKDILVMSEAEFTNNDAYKQLKDAIMEIFGPKQEDAVDRALSRVMVGKPSQLARALVNDICKKKLKNCQCCPSVVLAIWKRSLSSQVKAGIAHCEFNADTFPAVVKLADAIHSSNAPPATVAAIAAPATNLNETQPAIQYPVPEVAAAQRGGKPWRGGRNNRGGRGGRNNRGGGNSGGGQSQSQGPKHKGTKHPDLPPGDWNGCSMHFRFGKNAYFCAEPATCPWKNIFKPRD